MSSAISDPTNRFSNRGENYVRSRPGYPPEVVALLRRECGLTPQSEITDIGFGTGLFTRLLLENGNRVVGVEPNDAMRHEGERILASYLIFRSVCGSAEATTLAAGSVDFVTAAQAAHWFRREQARAEFLRILRTGGWVVLIWNERSTDSSPFLVAYEKLLLTYGTDYQDVRHEKTTETIDAFFAPSHFEQRGFSLRQEFDYAGLEGRLLSSSYTPDAGQSGYQPMLTELRRIYDQFQVKGRVGIDYRTRVYLSQLR